MKTAIKNKAHYPLPTVKEFFRQGQWITTKTVETSTVALGLNPQIEIPRAIEKLTNHNFLKSVEDVRFKGEWQDAYALMYEGHNLYIKLTMRTVHGRTVLLLSFKENQI